MDTDALLLARLQFAFTIAVHIIFPAFTIGLVGLSSPPCWSCGAGPARSTSTAWPASGPRSSPCPSPWGWSPGIPLSYQFGTNWSRFSDVIGNVIGPLIGYEVLTAFFLEATFLGVMLFGWKRVPPWLHVTSAVLVAARYRDLGLLDPRAPTAGCTRLPGYVIRGTASRFRWTGWAIIFNPSFPYRFAHMMTAAYLTTSVVVMAVGARYLLARRYLRRSRGPCCGWGVGMIADPRAVAAPHRRPARAQHARAPADQGGGDGGALGRRRSGGSACCSASPDQNAERDSRRDCDSARIASLILTHSMARARAGPQGLCRPSSARPSINVFFAFRIMVGIGLPLILLGLVGAVLWVAEQGLRGALVSAIRRTRVAARVHRDRGRLGDDGNGRQPSIVKGILRTADAASPVAAPTVAIIARCVRRHVLPRVLDRRVLHPQAHSAGAEGCGSGAAFRRARPGESPARACAELHP